MSPVNPKTIPGKQFVHPPRVSLAAFLDRAQRDELTALAHREDRSLSSIVRMALAGYLEARAGGRSMSAEDVLAQARARQRAITERFAKHLDPGTTSEQATVAMLQKDTRMLKQVLAIWRRFPSKAGGTVILPSGRIIPSSREKGVVTERRPRRERSRLR